MNFAIVVQFQLFVTEVLRICQSYIVRLGFRSYSSQQITVLVVYDSLGIETADWLLEKGIVGSCKCQTAQITGEFTLELILWERTVDDRIDIGLIKFLATCNLFHIFIECLLLFSLTASDSIDTIFLRNEVQEVSREW